MVLQMLRPKLTWHAGKTLTVSTVRQRLSVSVIVGAAPTVKTNDSSDSNLHLCPS